MKLSHEVKNEDLVLYVVKFISEMVQDLKKNYFIKLLVKFNFATILFYAPSLKNAFFYDFGLIFQIFFVLRNSG